MEFFEGWRRKAGIATLFISCMFAAVWVRSTILEDEFHFKSPLGVTDIVVTSANEGLVFAYWSWKLESHISRRVTWYSLVKIKFPFRKAFFVRNDPNKWAFDFLGFYVGRSPSSVCEQGILIVPYYAIVIPLTLLAAVLLLTKPRPSAPKNLLNLPV